MSLKNDGVNNDAKEEVKKEEIKIDESMPDLSKAIDFKEEDFHPENGDYKIKLGDKFKIIKGSGNKKNDETDDNKTQEEVDLNNIPDGWTFDIKKKSGFFLVRDYSIEAKIPTIGDRIAIESRRSILTRGQYALMSMNSFMSEITILDFVDALSMLQIVCKLPDHFPCRENLAEITDEDDESLVMEVYTAYIKWQKFFRKNMGGKS